MSIFKKISEARVKLQGTKINKSGENKFAKFKYYELADFLPTLNKINLELGICTRFEIIENNACLTVFDIDKQEDNVTFTIPYVSSELKGATKIQELGATITYLRRYLFLVAFEITDGEVVDAQPLQEQPKSKVEDKKPFDRKQAEKCILELVGDNTDLLEKEMELKGIKSFAEADERILKMLYKDIKARLKK